MADPRLSEAERLWQLTVQTISPTDKVGIVYHGDMDGVIGGTYAQSFLQNRFVGLRPSTYWVGTDEYDFVELRTWVKAQSLDHCFFFDMSIVNNAEAVTAIADSVRGKVFISDHHLLNRVGVQLPSTVILANPTPISLRSDETPVPTFAFARRLALAGQLCFPDWLLALAVFAEGVDDFFSSELKAVAESLPELKGKGTLRERYRRSSFARAATLVRAAYSIDTKDDEVRLLLLAVTKGNLPLFTDFLARLEKLFALRANEISTQISNLVSEWGNKIETRLKADKLIIIRVDGPHAVAGPVVSILRGRYPEKVMMGWVAIRGHRVIELRTGNRQPINFVEILHHVGAHVRLLNYGGHATAAGASVAEPDFDAFVHAFGQILETVYPSGGNV